MKKYIAGLLTGIILSLSLTTFAAVKLEAIPSPFPILIDGIKSTIEAYNIKGSTYIKLADLKAAGVDANFNSEKKQIEINTIEGSTTIAEPAIPESEKTNSGLPDFSVPEIDQTSRYIYNPTNLDKGDENVKETTYSNMASIEYNGNTYVNVIDIRRVKSIDSKFIPKNNLYQLYKDNMLILETTDATPKYYVNYNGFTYFNTEFIGKYLD